MKYNEQNYYSNSKYELNGYSLTIIHYHDNYHGSYQRG